MDNKHDDDDDPFYRQPPGRGRDEADAGSAGGMTGASGAQQPRKPRIEVLRTGPAAAPEPGVATSAGKPSIEVLGGGTQEAAQPHSPAMASGQPHEAEASPGRRGRGPFRSLTALLALLALALIAFILLSTYFQRERDRDYVEGQAAVKSENREVVADPRIDDEAPPAPVADVEAPPAAEPGDEPPAAQPAPLARPSPSEPAEAPVERTPEEPAPEAPGPGGETSALATVRAFYGALGAGDGASAAQLVVPSKRQSGPLSAGALTRYYSSFRRPLRVRGVTLVDADTVRIAYDYVLADGRLCRGEAAVNVVGSGDRKLVSSIRTRGPC